VKDSRFSDPSFNDAFHCKRALESWELIGGKKREALDILDLVKCNGRETIKVNLSLARSQ
jgi:hypothetical protein